MDRPKSSLQEDNLVPPNLRRFVPIIGSIIAGLALVGYIMGIRELPPVDRGFNASKSDQGHFPEAVTYGKLHSTPLWNNPLSKQTIKELKFAKPDLFEKVTKTDEMILASVQDRTRNRAYEGAPPTVPHPIDQFSSAACLACHQDGIKVGERVASRMSHQQLSNCTQCHVSSASYVSAEQTADLSTFVGIRRSGAGERASAGAPPIIPHHLWMRENCLPCHGTLSRDGIRSTHHWLTNCQQCHAANSTRDPSMSLAAGR